MKLYLASGSPRRAELLAQVGVLFTQLLPSVDETRLEAEAPHDYVRRLASDKARAGMVLAQAQTNTEPFGVLGADTIVVLGDRVFGKPGDAQEHLGMLRSLSGRSHEVYTAVALQCSPGAHVEPRLAITCTAVQFRELEEKQIQRYWASGEPRDKAGGYAIQGIGALFVESINGSYSGVVGLPLCETGILLREAGIATALTGTPGEEV